MKHHGNRTQLFRRINAILSLILFFLILYIFFSPYVPYITLYLDQVGDKTQGFSYQNDLASQQGVDQSALKPVPEENTLVIPKIHVDAEVLESKDASVLNQGIWRRPHTSTPEDGGNTVIVAHRFLYTSGPQTFYHLDKLEEGDVFSVYWDGKPYNYEVFDVQVVPPDAVEIEENTEEEIVTLYTCTPLWTSENRLVVRGRRIGNE